MNSVLNAVFKLILGYFITNETKVQTCGILFTGSVYDRDGILRLVILKLNSPGILKIAIP